MHIAESSAFRAETHFGHSEEEQVPEYYLRAARVIQYVGETYKFTNKSANGRVGSISVL